MVKRVKSGPFPCFFECDISSKQTKQLILYSNEDSVIKRFTSDRERFSDKNAFLKWKRLERIVYTLTDKTKEGNLLGIIWFGKKQLPKRKFIKPLDEKRYIFTFAIRIYKPARRTGCSKGFMSMAFDEFRATKIYKNSKNKGFWLETSVDNLPAVKSYLRFGFSQVTKPDTNNKIIMLYNS